MTKIFILTTALLAVGCAKDAPGTTAPTAENTTLRDGPYARFDVLLGEWAGTGSLTVGSKTMAVTSKFRCNVARGGVAVLCVHDATIEGMGAMVENALIGIDPASQELHWYNINTMGETHDHRGRWTSDTRIEWSYKGEKDGKPLVEAISMDFAGNSIAFRSKTTVDGAQTALFEGRLKK